MYLPSVYFATGCIENAFHKDLIELLTDFNFAWTSGEKYKRCSQYVGAAKDNRKLYMNCDNAVEGRYLYLYLPASNVLTMCEVEAYNESEYKKVFYSLRIMQYNMQWKE